MENEEINEKIERPGYIKEFFKWHEVKSATEERDTNRILIQVGAVWLTRFGVNIGSELDGKGNEFLRPVIVVKRINDQRFFGVPVSSKVYEDYFRQTFMLLGKQRDAVLSDMRAFDKKRCMRFMTMLDEKTLHGIIRRIRYIFIEDGSPQPP